MSAARSALLLLGLQACTWVGDAALADRLAANDSGCLGCPLQIDEALPDRTVAPMEPSSSILLHDSLVSQQVGVLSAVGLVDTVNGGCAFATGTTGWEGGNDSDAYTFAVPARARLALTGDWDDESADLDFGVWALDEAAGWVDIFSQYGPDTCLASDKPSLCESSVALEPDTEYQLIVLGYLGEGVEPYEISLEWLAP